MFSIGKASVLLNQLLGRIQYLARYHATVNRDQSQACLAVIENQGAGVQLVMHVPGNPILHSTVTGNAKPGSDVAGRCSCAELSLWLGDCPQTEKNKGQGEQSFRGN